MNSNRLLFELGTWQIRRGMPLSQMPPVGGEGILWAAHTSCRESPAVKNKDEYRYSWFFNEKPDVCVFCGTPVPEEIQALIILHGEI